MLEASYARCIAEMSCRTTISSRPRALHLACHHTRSFTSQTRRLAAASPPPPPPPQPHTERVPTAAELAKYAAKVGRGSGLLRSATEPYAAFGSTEKLWAECARQADYTVPSVRQKPSTPAPKNDAGEDIGEGTGLWFAPREQGGLALPVTFMNWAQVMYLHIWLLTVRLRRLPPEHVRIWQQHLTDHFFHAAEDKMEIWHGMTARGVRNKNLKDLWLQWRGVQLSYDEGLIKGDATLGSAVWRAIFKADPNASIADIALVTAYTRHELQRLDTASPMDVSGGNVRFGDFRESLALLNAKSAQLSTPFTAEETADVADLEKEIAKTANKR